MESTKPTYTIDAKGRPLGRVATEVALSLMGKKTADYTPHAAPTITVEVINTDHLEISVKKKREKIYQRYSGYPGGLKEETMAAVLAKHGSPEVLRRTVYTMLPNNKLRNERMKNLSIKA